MKDIIKKDNYIMWKDKILRLNELSNNYDINDFLVYNNLFIYFNDNKKLIFFNINKNIEENNIEVKKNIFKIWISNNFLYFIDLSANVYKINLEINVKEIVKCFSFPTKIKLFKKDISNNNLIFIDTDNNIRILDINNIELIKYFNCFSKNNIRDIFILQSLYLIQYDNFDIVIFNYNNNYNKEYKLDTAIINNDIIENNNEVIIKDTKIIKKELIIN